MATIKEILESLHLQHHLQKFVDNEVTWDIFPYLNENDLLRIGLPVGPCKKVFIYIQQHYPDEEELLKKRSPKKNNRSRSPSPEFRTPLTPSSSSSSSSIVVPPTPPPPPPHSSSSSSSNDADLRVNPVRLVREYQDFKDIVHVKFKESKEQMDMLNIRLSTLEQALVKHYQPF